LVASEWRNGLKARPTDFSLYVANRGFIHPVKFADCGVCLMGVQRQPFDFGRVARSEFSRVLLCAYAKVGRIAASWIVACMHHGQAFRDFADPKLVRDPMSAELVTCRADFPVTPRGRASPYPATVFLFLNPAE
jgi:hypothetical protein